MNEKLIKMAVLQGLRGFEFMSNYKFEEFNDLAVYSDKEFYCTATLSKETDDNYYCLIIELRENKMYFTLLNSDLMIVENKSFIDIKNESDLIDSFNL